MKLLTTMTIVLSIPTMVSSFYGMNIERTAICGLPQWILDRDRDRSDHSLLVAIIFSKRICFSGKQWVMS